MEVIRINEGRMKIMLTATDMCRYALDPGSLGEGDPETHKAFRRLLEEVHQRTGFDAEEPGVTVQFFPSREGGCEMFISRLTGEGASSPRRLLPPREPGGRNAYRRECAYRIPCLDDLMALCQRLRGLSSVDRSALLADQQGCYYLRLSCLTPSPFSLPEELQFLSEYGCFEDPARLEVYITEHGRVLCPEHAIERLSGRMET